MRVAYVCADPGVPVWGSKGASAHVRAVVRAFRRRGADVRLFAARTGGAAPPDLESVPVVELPAAGSGPAAERERQALDANDHLRAALEATARAGRFDVVYERYSLWSFAAMSYAHATSGVRSLLEVNAPLVDEQARHRTLHHRDVGERVARRVLGLADGVVAVSEPVAAWTRSLGARNVAVLPNGVDLDRFGSAGLAASRPPANDRAFTVAFVGSLKPWHGVDVLVDAMGRLVHEGGTAATRLLIVGDGPGRDAIEACVARNGIHDATTFTGAVDPDEVPSWLALADVGAAPYPAGADAYFSPLKVLEYLGAGLPVVGSAVGQVPMLLDHGRAGIPCPPGDVEALAKALRRLRASPALRARMGAHGRALAVDRHSWDTVTADALASVGLAAPRSGRPRDRAA